jgi:zona occludens toxin
MPINAFGGGPGSGKTYGVMEHVILPAIAKGRFVITNIDGLNDELIYEYVSKEFYKGKIFCIGHIRHCDRSAPEEEKFFPGDAQLDKPCSVPALDCKHVVGGDLVVIDEATRYWSTAEKVKKGHAFFFREHRHFANDLGDTCDLVVIDPDLTMLARALKGKVELASITHKPKEVGLNRYVVKLYKGVKLTGKPTATLGPYKFQKEIYSLYKSYAHENAKEQSIDKRQNIFSNPRVWLMMGAIVALLCFSIYGLYWYYQRQLTKFSPKKDDEKSLVPGSGSVSGVPVPVPGSAAVGGGTSPVVASQNTGSVSDSLRIAGEVVLHGERWVMVQDDTGVRLENPQAFSGRGVLMVGTVAGRRVNAFVTVPKKMKESK